MTNFVALPLLATLCLAMASGPLLDRLRPATSARSSAVLLFALTVAAVPTLWLLGLSGVAHLGFHNSVVDWCRHLLPEHRPVGAVLGIASLIAALTGTARAISVLIQHHRMRCTHTHPVEFIDTDEVYAYTLPGPARTIAISDGLRNSLDDHEFDVVLAHERSHARNRHDRFKLLGLVTTAFVPPVTRLASRLDYYLERWADEDALRDTGVDRRVAARTIAKVALAAASPQPALGIADHGVTARAAALLRPIEQPGVTTRIQTSLVIAATLALAAYQLHHSAMFAADLVG